jgi:dihydroorotase
MNILIKSATILDKSSTYNNQTKDILIENGIIIKIDDTIKNTNNLEEVSHENLHVSQGWFDSSVSFGEPGFEERETIINGLQTAGISGFTDILVNPNTNPVIDNSATVSFIKSKGFQHAVNIHPIGALTKNSDGDYLAELYDMQQSGAVAFGDFQSAIENPNMLKIALQYAQNFNGLVLSYPQENKIAGKGIVNEEENATKLGLKGIPNLAEELQIARDLFLLEYTGGKLHIPTLSTAKSVELIKVAKLKGLDITCSVSILNLILTDDAITDFNTNFKILPPLRTSDDRKALLAGVQDGTIDFVTSNHTPIDIEFKNIEFDHAQYGSIGLESIFGALNSIFTTEQVVELLTQKKERFGLSATTISEGKQANITLFNPETIYQFTKEDIQSTSKNSALLGSTLKGKALGIINNNQLILK